MLDYRNLRRRIMLFVGWGLWTLLMLSVASFSPSDWPSHQAWPHPPVSNVCGRVGALIAYHAHYAIGQGIYIVLLFAGICLLVVMRQKHISDLWLRAIGLLILAVAFSAALHLINPAVRGGLPEGSGGVLGIAAAAFLKQYFHSTGAVLLIIMSMLVGLLLAADDLVMSAPAAISRTVQGVRQGVARINWRFAAIPRLPALPRFVTRDAARAARDSSADGEDEAGSLRPATVLRQNTCGVNEKIPLEQTVIGQQIELTYDEEQEAAAVEIAYRDENEAPPAAPVEVPPPEKQAVAQAPPVINNLTAATVSGEAAPGQDAKQTGGTEQTSQAVTATASAGVGGTGSAGEIVVRLPTPVRTRAVPPPKELGDYRLPPWDCLADAEHDFAEQQEKYVREKAAVLEQALREFQIDARVVEIDTGPVITMYELALAPGVKVSAITALSNDIARALMATSVRIVAPVPGKSTVGIEVPNPVKEKVRLKELMQLAPEAVSRMTLPLFLGKDASGEPLVADLASMPHCLIAGTTGSGKSVCINAIIMSFLYTQRPDMVKLILIDPKVVEMAPFKDIPHLMCPVINDTARATAVLEWACEKMDERYEILAEAGVRNIAGYNKLTREELIDRFKPADAEEEAKIPKFLPYVVIIVDELADLMMTSGKEVEQSVVRLAQKSRAVGIHLILATQRPQATVVTGLIKSNMPSRIAFRVQSRMDSRIVLDQNGADLLLGQGDMLFLPPGCSKPIRAQGTYIDDREMRETVRLVREQAEAQYEPELMQVKSRLDPSEMEKDELFDDAVRIILETRRGSVSLLQRRLNIGYGRASRLIEMMAAAGIVGEYKGSQAREALMTLEEWEALKAQQQKDAQDGMSV